MDPSLKPPVVFDLGTGFLKVGLSTSPVPDYILPNAVGRPVLRSDESFAKLGIRDLMISDETTPVRQYLDITLPVEHGIVKNWDDETLIIDYILKKKLSIDPSEHPIFITEAPRNPMDNRKMMCEVFFETLNVPAIQVAPQALLVAYARGMVTCTIVDSGDGVTHVVPIAENYILTDLIRRMNIAGRDVTEQLIKLLTLRGYSFHKSADFEVVREIKEKYCFLSANPAIDRKLALETTTYTIPITLPDSRQIKIAGERFEAPEILFNPSLIPKEEPGISSITFDTIMSAPINYRKPFFESIIVSGGTTMFPGFSTRLTNDLRQLVLQNVLKGDAKKLDTYKINVEDPPNRRFLVYQGGTVLANLTKDKAKQWALKQDMQEVGVDQIIRRWQTVQ